MCMEPEEGHGSLRQLLGIFKPSSYTDQVLPEPASQLAPLQLKVQEGQTFREQYHAPVALITYSEDTF